MDFWYFLPLLAGVIYIYIYIYLHIYIYIYIYIILLYNYYILFLYILYNYIIILLHYYIYLYLDDVYMFIYRGYICGVIQKKKAPLMKFSFLLLFLLFKMSVWFVILHSCFLQHRLKDYKVFGEVLKKK